MSLRCLVFALVAMTLAGATHEYKVRGLVTRVDLVRSELEVSEDPIPGYMDAMIMAYHVVDPEDLQSLRPGMKVAFQLKVDANTSSISGIRVISYSSADREPLEARSLAALSQAIGGSKTPHALSIGDYVPDFTLTDQTGRTVSLHEFAGKVVAITFVYTRCPLPDYCLRLSNNFGQLQRRFQNRLGTDLVLLSISFDPVHDTPAVLAKYGKIWNANPIGWHLLTGPIDQVKFVSWRLGANFWQEEGALTHSLHTAVIDRHGRLAANLEGNQFSAFQLGDLVQVYF